METNGGICYGESLKVEECNNSPCMGKKYLKLVNSESLILIFFSKLLNFWSYQNCVLQQLIANGEGGGLENAPSRAGEE